MLSGDRLHHKLIGPGHRYAIGRHAAQGLAIADEIVWRNCKVIVLSNPQIEIPIFAPLSIAGFEGRIIAADALKALSPNQGRTRVIQKIRANQRGENGSPRLELLAARITAQDPIVFINEHRARID